jgi:DME family drug/metabolite transporter
MLANPRGAAEHSARHGLLLAVGAATLWGTVGVASKMLPDGATLPSFDLAFARLAIAAPLLVLFSGLFLGRALWANAARAWPWIAAVGVLAACYQFCLFVSLEQLGVARTALLTVCLPPVLIAGVSALIHHRRPSARTTGALLMALGSLMLVTGSSKGLDAVPGAAPLLGLAAGILAAMAFASLSALARALAGHVHPLQAVSLGFAVGAVLLAAIVTMSGRPEPGEIFGAGTTLESMLILVYLGTVPTALAYICYFYGMQLSRTATSGVAATLVEPAVAVLLAAGLLGEHLPLAAWLGVACLLFATILLGLAEEPVEAGQPRRRPVVTGQRAPSER